MGIALGQTESRSAFESHRTMFARARSHAYETVALSCKSELWGASRKPFGDALRIAYSGSGPLLPSMRHDALVV